VANLSIIQSIDGGDVFSLHLDCVIMEEACPKCLRPISEAIYMVKQSVADTRDNVRVLVCQCGYFREEWI